MVCQISKWLLNFAYLPYHEIVILSWFVGFTSENGQNQLKEQVTRQKGTFLLWKKSQRNFSLSIQFHVENDAKSLKILPLI